MTKKSKLFLATLQILFIGSIVYLGITSKKDKNMIESYEEKIEVLEKEKDSLKNNNASLHIENDAFETKIVELDAKLSLTNDTITSLKNELRQKIATVDNYTPVELQNFFTKRYAVLFPSSSSQTNN